MVNSILHQYSIEQAVWHYEHGLMVTAINEVGKAFRENRFVEFSKAWVDHFVKPDGSIRTYHVEEFNLDQVNPGKLLFGLYKSTAEERYGKALALIRSQLRNQPRNESGGFWHKKIYPHQMWLDGIYMAAPFYAEYASTFDEPTDFDDITHQLILCEQHTRDTQTGLLFHAWDESKTQKWADPITGCSPNFWGRAIGWYVMGLVDVLDFLPPSHNNYSTCLEILHVARPDTLSRFLYWTLVSDCRWCWKPGNYAESSVSAMLAYGFAKAVRKGWLGSETLLSAQRAYRGLLENQIKVDAQGFLTLENTCGVGGLGGVPYRDGSYEYYISEKIITNDFKGVGPFVLAALEMETAD
jgi:unsaturated rhamnogalacturonyl hydrolase